MAAAQRLMDGLGTSPADYQHVIFHQPNTKFPQRVARALGFEPDQVQTGMLVALIGNTYAGSSLLGLTAVLDTASAGDRILLVSYGSGAGSDAFSLRTTEELAKRQGLALKTQDYINRRTEIDYATYARYRGKLTTK
jgi:hydroxymethylglutaryl-CoA synthase